MSMHCSDKWYLLVQALNWLLSNKRNNKPLNVGFDFERPSLAVCRYIVHREFAYVKHCCWAFEC